MAITTGQSELIGGTKRSESSTTGVDNIFAERLAGIDRKIMGSPLSKQKVRMNISKPQSSIGTSLVLGLKSVKFLDNVE